MIVHGPGVFDYGDVSFLQRELHPQRILVAGIMARTAAEESGLMVEFSGEPPSILIRRLQKKVFLVNRAKTPKSGRIFGEIVASRVPLERGLLHLECSSRTLYLWNHADEDLGNELAERTGFETIHTMSALPARSSSLREIRGCLPGEAVCINGVVIGHATAETVVVTMENGTLQPLSGIIPKLHGLDKLHRTWRALDLTTAWCKSGTIRTSPPSPKHAPFRRGRIGVIDHKGTDLYRLMEEQICGILAIGDDTTCICGHIAAHRGIPVLGIVDGDCDQLVEAGYASGSVVVQVEEGKDDIIGGELGKKVTGEAVCWEDWVRWALSELKGRAHFIHHIP
jgi:hypothetical protein